MQLLPGVYQLAGSLAGLGGDQILGPWDECNVYLVDCGSSYTLIDGGNGENMEIILERMALWGLNPQKISTLLLTHAHWDHSGGVHLFKERGVRIVASEVTADSIANADHRCAGFLYHKHAVPTEADHIISDREIITVGSLSFEAIHLPGHTLGCMAYIVTMNNQKVLFSGDVIGTLGWGDFGWDGSVDFDKKKYTESLFRLQSLDFDVMLGGHGMGSFTDPIKRVDISLNQALIQWR
ncbi:MAG: MBL fold metallo-hydrolase [Sphaerochaeta sp.]